MWLKYTLLAERHTRGLRRVFVEYTNLLGDWRREIARISAALAIDLNTRDEDAIEKFLQDLYRQRHRGPVTESFGSGWISRCMTRCARPRGTCRGISLRCDRVFEAYRASEFGFRTAFKDFHRLHKFNWLIRPSILNLIYEVLAMAHRRNGTWA